MMSVTTFGDHFVRVGILIIMIKLNVYQSDINQEYSIKEMLKENISGLSPGLHIKQAGMICYFNFLA